MNAMTMQLTSGLAMAARERAKVVGISSPEYHAASSTDILAVVAFFLVCILAIAAIVVGGVMLFRHVKGKGASGAARRSPAAPRPVPMQTPAAATHCCTSCGTSIPQVSRFCPNCGAGQR